MFVKMLRNPAKSYGCTLTEGQTGEVSSDVGERLIKDNLAERVLEPLRTVPPTPAIAHAAQPSITGVQATLPPTPETFNKLPVVPPHQLDTELEVSPATPSKNESVDQATQDAEDYRAKHGGKKTK